MISKYRVDCGYELFFSTFRSFKKKLNIVLDYGARRKDILKSLYALRCSDNLFVLRSERMLTVGLPVKVRYYQLSEEDFDAYVNFTFHLDGNQFFESKLIFFFICAGS